MSELYSITFLIFDVFICLKKCRKLILRRLRSALYYLDISLIQTWHRCPNQFGWFGVVLYCKYMLWLTDSTEECVDRCNSVLTRPRKKYSRHNYAYDHEPRFFFHQCNIVRKICIIPPCTLASNADTHSSTHPSTANEAITQQEASTQHISH